MAEKKTIELEIKSNLGDAEKSLGSLKSQLRQAQNEVAALSDKFGATSKEAIAAAKNAAILADKIGDAKSLTDAFNPDAKFRALSGALTGVAGGFAVVTGALGVMGSESKEVEEAILKVQSAMAIASGAQAIGESVDQFRQLGAVVRQYTIVQKVVTAGQWLWNAAMAANPIGLLVAGVAALVAGGVALTNYFMSNAEAAKINTASINANKTALNNQSKTADSASKSLQTNSDYQLAMAKASGASTDAIRKLELKLIDEKIAFANSSREIAKNTYHKNLNALASLKASDADSGTVEASNQLLSSLAVLRNISYVNQGYTQQINADKFVKLGGTSAQYLMADGSTTTGGGGGGGATNLAYTASPTNGIVTSDTGTDATIPLADGTNAGLLTPAEKTKISNSVPYTGANANVNLGEFGLTAGQVTLDTTPTGTATVATTRWNDSFGGSETTLKGGTVVLKNGVDLVARIVNKVTPNTTLTKAAYQAVKVVGATGQRLSVELAQGDSDLNSADTIGLVTETIATNQEGFIITMGQLENINTTGSLQGETWADGNVLYLSPTVAGRLTNIKPTGATGHIVVIGYVEYAHANNGKIYVKIMNGWELDELHNVFIDNTLANQDFLQYESSSDLWKNKPLTDTLIKSKLGITTLSGSNTGDNATNTQYSGLAASKQDTLQNTVNIKSINGQSIVGSGNVTISATVDDLDYLLTTSFRTLYNY